MTSTDSEWWTWRRERRGERGEAEASGWTRDLCNRDRRMSTAVRIAIMKHDQVSRVSIRWRSEVVDDARPLVRFEWRRICCQTGDAPSAPPTAAFPPLCPPAHPHLLLIESIECCLSEWRCVAGSGSERLQRRVEKGGD